MLTRRKLIVNGLPAMMATAGVCVGTEANAEPTTDELLQWAKDNNLFLRVDGNGTALVEAIFTVQGIDRTGRFGGVLDILSRGDTLREALLRARVKIEKGANDGTP